MKICCIARLTDHDNCVQAYCDLWDEDKTQCLIRSYMQGYIKMQLQSLEVLKMGNRLQKRIDRAQDEDDEDLGTDL